MQDNNIQNIKQHLEELKHIRRQMFINWLKLSGHTQEQAEQIFSDINATLEKEIKNEKKERKDF